MRIEPRKQSRKRDRGLTAQEEVSRKVAIFIFLATVTYFFIKLLFL